jgi:hypothetical protein
MLIGCLSANASRVFLDAGPTSVWHDAANSPSPDPAGHMLASGSTQPIIVVQGSGRALRQSEAGRSL